MRIILTILLCVLSIMAAGGQALAQVKSDPGQLLVAPPLIDIPRADGSRCFVVVNNAPYSVTGTINTAYFTAADGTNARKNVNFRLGPGKRQEICTYGPYHRGMRVEFVLRTLFPIFSCFTVAQGEIQIHGKTTPEGSKTWADCL